jgi:hypothetical protein
MSAPTTAAVARIVTPPSAASAAGSGSAQTVVDLSDDFLQCVIEQCREHMEDAWLLVMLHPRMLSVAEVARARYCYYHRGCETREARATYENCVYEEYLEFPPLFPIRDTTPRRVPHGRRRVFVTLPRGASLDEADAFLVLCEENYVVGILDGLQRTTVLSASNGPMARAVGDAYVAPSTRFEYVDGARVGTCIEFFGTRDGCFRKEYERAEVDGRVYNHGPSVTVAVADSAGGGAFESLVESGTMHCGLKHGVEYRYQLVARQPRLLAVTTWWRGIQSGEWIQYDPVPSTNYTERTLTARTAYDRRPYFATVKYHSSPGVSSIRYQYARRRELPAIAAALATAVAARGIAAAEACWQTCRVDVYRVWNTVVGPGVWMATTESGVFYELEFKAQFGLQRTKLRCSVDIERRRVSYAVLEKRNTMAPVHYSLELPTLPTARDAIALTVTTPFDMFDFSRNASDGNLRMCYAATSTVLREPRELETLISELRHEITALIVALRSHRRPALFTQILVDDTWAPGTRGIHETMTSLRTIAALCGVHYEFAVPPVEELDNAFTERDAKRTRTDTVKAATATTTTTFDDFLLRSASQIVARFSH